MRRSTPEPLQRLSRPCGGNCVWNRSRAKIFCPLQRLLSCGDRIVRRFQAWPSLTNLPTALWSLAAGMDSLRIAKTQASADSLAFALAPTPDLDPTKDKHMHSATYTFIDADHFRLAGVAWENGQSMPCDDPVIFTRQ
jgi:hypothetical protein